MLPSGGGIYSLKEERRNRQTNRKKKTSTKEMLTITQSRALRAIQEGHSIFLGGAAGTGKTFLVEKVVEAVRRRGRRVALTCTTGIACSNYSQVYLNFEISTSRIL